MLINMQEGSATVETHTSAYTFNGDGLGPIRCGRKRLFGWVERGVEECIDECRFAQTRLAYT
jgi:hypothetical protein